MPPADDRTPARSPSQAGRRLISRLTSPFASKSRSVTELFVELDEPHRQYSPGDIVTGSVTLRVNKAVRVTHIVVCLHGFVQVFKHPGSPGEGFRSNHGYLGAGRGKKSGEYFGNGFASLFEDEVILCGDGRLAEGPYQFNFELEFPDRDLPSSIDFERGTISYIVSATVTRPTPINPTLTCDRKVYLVERIDISPLCAPKPRTITLEPISRRSRVKHQARKLVDPGDKRSRKTGSVQPSDSSHRSRQSSPTSSRAGDESLTSPSPSEVSCESYTESHDRQSQQEPMRQVHSTSEDGVTLRPKNGHANRSITVTVECLNGGCLRGDTVEIKVKVKHTKLVRSLYGVIVTLYRSARVDLHPAIPLGPAEKGKTLKYEDYYPRSITGLGGLSLSGAGSSHVFRKDLTQSLAPLYVDPSNMTAEVNAKVRVPDEAFPTISTVPGAMISFKYHVEVVLDVQGKLGSSGGALSSLNGLANTQLNVNSFRGLETDRLAPIPFGASIVDTTQIRRDKSVVTCAFEVIVGTRDSERRKGKRKAEPLAKVETEEAAHGEELNHTGSPDTIRDGIQTNMGAEVQVGTPATHWYERPPHGEPGYENNDGHPGSGFDRDMYGEWPPAIPIPHIPDTEKLSEKERIRQAETRLLPSQPPGEENSDVYDEQQAPTAPFLAIDEHIHPSIEVGPSAPAYEPPVIAGPASRELAELTQMPHSYVLIHSPTSVSPTDDKKELQRQLLESEASAPPEDAYVEENAEAGPSSPAQIVMPSAPPLDSVTNAPEDAHNDDPTPFELPRYQR